MKRIPDFDIELSQASDYIMTSPLARKAFSNPPFPQYTNILRILIQSVDRLADNCHMPEFTNHALPHICSIVRRASQWASEDGWLDDLTEQEAGYLLLALVIHDIGMLSQDAKDLPEEDRNVNMKGFADIANWVRRTHVIRLKGLVLRLLKEELEEDEKEQCSRREHCSLQDHMMVVIGMAASHQCWEWEPQFVSAGDEMEKLNLDVERVAALNSVIAVSDLLDEDSNRCDTITLIKYRHGTMENLAHWIRHALTVEVDGVRDHKVTVTFRKLIPWKERHEKIYRALRNHYRLVKLYNSRLKKINAEIEHLEFHPMDGIPDLEDEISNELAGVWVKLPEFKNHIVEQILSTFMPEALNRDAGDAGMRQRLDQLGLESLDLTEEDSFLKPPTIYFSDERILFHTSDFLDELAYVKEQVDTAYLDGNIGKIRHLCLTVLKDWNTKVSLNEIYWVFVYVAVLQKFGNEKEYLIYDYDNSFSPREGENSDKLEIEGDYPPLFDVLFCLQRPATGEQWYKKYVSHIKEHTYASLKDDSATALLLETLVGLLWYYDPDGWEWQEVAEHLGESLPCGLARKLTAYVRQLKKQHKIIYHPRDIDINGESCSHPMEKAWIDFWNGDWQSQEKNISKLCQMENYDRDYMEPIQGYLNLVQNDIQHQHWFAKRQKKQTEEPEQISDPLEREARVGVYRYNRIVLEQPLPAFWEQRKLVIDSMINECRRNKFNSQLQRLQLVNLIALHTLDALRYWDLWQYMTMLRAETFFYYLNGTYVDKHGRYCGDKWALGNCFVNYIKGLDADGLSKEERKGAARLLVKKVPEELDVIVEFIVDQSISIQWPYAREVVETFAGNFSVPHRKRLINWLVKYHEYYRKQNRYFNITQYQFLRFWCPDMDEEDWKKVEILIQDIFLSQENMMTNQKLAEAIFDYAPWDLCMSYLDKIKTYPDNVRKSYDIYSAVITLSKRKVCDEALQEFVDGLLKDVEQKTEGEDLPGIRSRYEELKKLIGTEKLEEREPVDLAGIEENLRQMKEKIKERGNLKGYDSTFMNPVGDAFVNKNWDVEDQEREKHIIDEIISIMKEHQDTISLLFFADFCRLLRYIENSCRKEICSYINHLVMENMVRRDFFLSQKQAGEAAEYDGSNGPYELFRFDMGTRNQYEISVTLLLVTGMTAFTDEEKPEAIRYMIKAMGVDEPVIYHYAAVMFGYFFLMAHSLCRDVKDAEITAALAWGGLQYILGRLAADSKDLGGEKEAEIREWVQCSIDNMKTSVIWFGAEGFCACAKKNQEYMDWLEAVDCHLD